MTKEKDKKLKEIFNKATDRLLDTLNNNPDELFDIKKLSKQLAEKSQKIYNLVRENRKLQSKIEQQDQIIREAREYAEEHKTDYICKKDRLISAKSLLEILDRNVK